MKHVFKIALLLTATFAWTHSFAQVQNETTPGYDFSAPPDSVQTDTTVQSGEETPQEPVDPLLKPYERIVLNIDSSTNLITYYGVVEQEESGSDSLYLRAKKWITNTFGKDVKLELDKRNQKITYVVGTTAYAYTSKYSRRDIGRYEFKITFFIKEGRYKYQISNLVHETTKPAAGGKPTRNYFEYYYTSTTRVRENDIILRNADKDINRFIESLKKAMREPIIVDEDDW